jgi:FKBP-type peptidyl-prolyl cis-trans isomerase FkpA
MTKLFYIPVLIYSITLFSSCNRRENHNGDAIESNGRSNKETNEVIKNQFIKANQQLMQKENDEMDFYAKSHKMPFFRTATGIRYFVYKPSAKGDSIRDSMRVSMDFEVRLLDGTLCYSSKTEGRRTFTVGHEDIESGIHKGVQYLKRGDKAILLIPSPLAHGLLGDFKKIPPQMPIVCDIAVY